MVEVVTEANVAIVITIQKVNPNSFSEVVIGRLDLVKDFFLVIKKLTEIEVSS